MSEFNYKQPFIVVGVLAEKDGKFLFVQEAEGPDKGKWNIPGGTLDPGETLQEGAAREFVEETGHQVVINCILGFYYATKEYPEWQSNALRVVFRGEVGEKTSGLAEDIVQLKWIAGSEVKEVLGSKIRTKDITVMVDDFQEGKMLPVDIVHYHKEKA